MNQDEKQPTENPSGSSNGSPSHRFAGAFMECGKMLQGEILEHMKIRGIPDTPESRDRVAANAIASGA